MKVCLESGPSEGFLLSGDETRKFFVALKSNFLEPHTDAGRRGGLGRRLGREGKLSVSAPEVEGRLGSGAGKGPGTKLGGSSSSRAENGLEVVSADGDLGAGSRGGDGGSVGKAWGVVGT